MDLSIVIVNYNVCHFLDQCLDSVEKALRSIDAEVWVVDNASVDRSVEMVKESYPWVQLIESQDNLGFSKGNNLAISKCTGKYVLLLNPDTVVGEDTFRKCLDYMNAYPDVGGLGIRMVDGRGNFLPESKRGLPTPWAAFCKMFGFSSLFPRSKRFGKYHLKYLAEDQDHQVEVLSGAYMWIRKEALDKVGLLDEQFFMYGEDIDLSYRIEKGGYQNHYFSQSTIIHYKGESTKKGSVNYVRVFYKAMAIFAKKHFSQGNAGMFSAMIQLAIYFRAVITLVSGLLKAVWLPLLDIAAVMAGLWLFDLGYEKVRDVDHPDILLWTILPVYSTIWVVGAYFGGMYDRPIQLRRGLYQVASFTVLILILYALLHENWRFSRAFILVGVTIPLIWFPLSRLVFSRILPGIFPLSNKPSVVALVAKEGEERRAIHELQELLPYRTAVIDVKDTGELHSILGEEDLDEVTFSCQSIRYSQIIDELVTMRGTGLEFKIANTQKGLLIGSNSINHRGMALQKELSRVNGAPQRRTKRALDVITSLLLMLSSPLWIWLSDKPSLTFKTLRGILAGSITWVGIPWKLKVSRGERGPYGLMLPGSSEGSGEVVDELEVYNREYRVGKDLQFIWRNRRILLDSTACGDR